MTERVAEPVKPATISEQNNLIAKRKWELAEARHRENYGLVSRFKPGIFHAFVPEAVDDLIGQGLINPEDKDLAILAYFDAQKPYSNVTEPFLDFGRTMRSYPYVPRLPGEIGRFEMANRLEEEIESWKEMPTQKVDKAQDRALERLHPKKFVITPGMLDRYCKKFGLSNEVKRELYVMSGFLDLSYRF